MLEATVLLNGLAAGGAAGADDPFERPKLKIGFDDASDVVGAAVGLDRVTAVGMLVLPKLNFGFDASLAEMVPVPGLEILLAVVAGLEGCENEKKLWGAAFEAFPCGADEAFETGLVDGAFTELKEKVEEFADPFASDTEDGIVVGCVFCAKKLGTVGLDETGPLAAGVDVELKLGIVGLDGTGALAAGVDVEVCIAGIGAEGKENKVGGAAATAGLPSDLSFASLGWEFEDSVGILNKGGGFEGSGACELPFENEGRENVDVAVGGATEGFSSDFAGRSAGKVGTVGAATFFASASLASASAFAFSAFAFSFSSALRRRRAIASASISCFSHFE